MYRSNYSSHELQLLQNRPGLFPGDPEPLWLTRAVQQEQALAALKADARAAGQPEPEPRGLVTRLRLVFSRA